MTKERRLQLEALAACEARHHDMKHFTRHSETKTYSHCRQCDAQVIVNTKPMPNEIDIGGEALAIPCEPGTTYAEREARLRAISQKHSV